MIAEKMESQQDRANVVVEGKRFYRPELDLLRFGAFLLVFWAHTIPSPEGPGLKLHLLRSIRYTGSLGVPVFFMLSSYLITELLLRERDLTGDIRVSSFYIRRMLRIWPLYFLVLFGTFMAGLFDPASGISLYALSSYVLLSGNWYTLLTGHWLPTAALPLWSIGIEEQFYLAWPTVVRYANRRSILIASAILWISSQIALWMMCSRNVMISPVVWINSFTHFQYFALGAIISVSFAGRAPDFSAATRSLLVILGISALFISEFHFNVFSRTDIAIARLTIPGYMLVGVGTSLLFISALGMTVSSWANPLVDLGKISYGLYVYHSICVHISIWAAHRMFHIERGRVIIAYLIGLPLTIILSKLSYRFFETPFLHLKEKFAVVQSRSI
jgi:peptidoglycan/LPS O-acetylase OafA/YrhL